ncbi:unnamed protein product [Ceratitis capitata]|uniref:(Mediterranean fruit fly) hypothetical protein n=1 Tax=Ceratitis capitata TaxID=7213 RepID=A0A811UN35_CERCA|nr:unnamed protein product [Ceratitis capitata]
MSLVQIVVACYTRANNNTIFVNDLRHVCARITSVDQQFKCNNTVSLHSANSNGNRSILLLLLLFLLLCALLTSNTTSARTTHHHSCPYCAHSATNWRNNFLKRSTKMLQHRSSSQPPPATASHAAPTASARAHLKLALAMDALGQSAAATSHYVHARTTAYSYTYWGFSDASRWKPLPQALYCYWRAILHALMAGVWSLAWCADSFRTFIVALTALTLHACAHLSCTTTKKKQNPDDNNSNNNFK